MYLQFISLKIHCFHQKILSLHYQFKWSLRHCRIKKGKETRSFPNRNPFLLYSVLFYWLSERYKILKSFAGIGRDFLLIKALGYREGFVRWKAVASVSIFLQGSKVVQEWWRRMRYLSCDRFHCKPALTAKCSESGLCRCFTLIVFTANGFQRHVEKPH